MKKLYILFFVAVIVAWGCGTPNSHLCPKSLWIVDYRISSEWDDFRAAASRCRIDMPDDPSDMINDDEFAQYVQVSGVATTQYLAEVSDVFYREQTLRISLHSDLQAKVLAEIVSSWFAQHDWNEERGLHWVESSIGENDWLRVYRRGDSLIRVHIVGLWENEKGFKPLRSISFRFYHCDSSVMFTVREDGGIIFND